MSLWYKFVGIYPSLQISGQIRRADCDAHVKHNQPLLTHIQKEKGIPVFHWKLLIYK